MQSLIQCETLKISKKNLKTPPSTREFKIAIEINFFNFFLLLEAA
jgi:hypothetical protein